jgi:DNA topoisomerase I
MPYTLVIVESPAKCQKIESYLGPGYKCIASYGHLQQLNSLNDIDISNNFKPKFIPIDTKRQQINKIKQLVSQSNEVVLATDDDREGEAISWHICQLFDLSITNTKRIIFHEVTKPAITKAINNPTTLNMSLVNAQLGRQILDLIVGYKISPVLWEQISRTMKLSAGRCQTPALKLVYENFIDINNSPGTKSYNTTGYFTDKNLPFILNHNYDNDDKMVEFLEITTEHDHILTCDKPKDSIRKSPQPFTTSTLQQTSSNELHISPKDTMQICQKLYEGGYITYMRTDSKIYSKDFVDKTIEYINKNYGVEYSCKTTNVLTDSLASKSNKKKGTKQEDDSKAQEAHEAIRPTNICVTKLPDDGDFTARERKLYYLIWKNTIESCMTDALFKTILARITAPEKYEYRYTCENLVFLGWKIIDYNHKQDIVIDSTKTMAYEYLPKIINKTIPYKKIVCKFTLKDLKSHYTEAKLVQLLEQKGIGRPSTFSSLIEKIQQRGYVKRENIKGKTISCTDFELENDEILETENKREFGNEKNKLVIQQTGILVIELLIKKYSDIFNYEYTKQMEDILDIIAKGEKEYHYLCRECLEQINTINDTMKIKKSEAIIIDDNHTYVIGKHGPVIKSTKTNKTEFISVKKDLDLEKLKNGEYKLEDIIQNSQIDKILGRYENQELLLKKGKFGLYVTWGNNKKSIDTININEDDITLDDVITFINKNKTNSNIIREITKEISIRTGQYGHYIFYKTTKMTKPKFIKLNNFEEDYLTCSTDTILTWLKDKL